MTSGTDPHDLAFSADAGDPPRDRVRIHSTPYVPSFPAVRTAIRLTVMVGFLASHPAALAASRAESPSAPRYDSSTVTTVSGTVTTVRRIFRGRDEEGVVLEASPDEGPRVVVLGPDYWLHEQRLRIRKGDVITVRGSLVVHDGKTLIVAQSIWRGQEHLILRSECGDPAWPTRPGR